MPQWAIAQPAATPALDAQQQVRLGALREAAEAEDAVQDPHAYKAAWEALLAFAETVYPPDHPELASIEGEIDFTYFILGEIEALPPRLERQRAIFAAAGPEWREEYIETVNNLGVVSDALGRSDVALEYQREAVSLWREDAPPEGSPALVQGLNNLAWSERGNGDLDQALALSTEALEIAERLFAAGELGDALVDAFAVGVNNRSIILTGMRRESEAEAVVREGVVRVGDLLGAGHPRVATLLLNGSVLLVRTGRFVEAETMARRALELRESAYGPESPAAAEARLNLLLALNSQGRYAEARPLAEYTVQVLDAAQGPTAPQTLEARARLATILFSAGEIDEGIDQTHALIDAYREIRPAGHEDIEWYQQVLSLQLGRAARWEEARTLLAELEQSRTGTPDEFRKDHLAMLALRAVAEGKVGDPQVARAYLDRAQPAMLEIWRGEVESEGAGGRPDRFTDWALGWLAVAAGDIGERERSFELAQYVGVGASERSLLRARQREMTADPEVAAAMRRRQDLVEQRARQIAAFDNAASTGDAAATRAAHEAIDLVTGQLDMLADDAAPLLAPQTAQDLTARIDPASALVFIVETDIHTRLYVLTAEGLLVEDSPLPTLTIQRLVTRLRDNLEAGLAQEAQFDTQAARELHDALFTPAVRAALADRETVSVIARGSLARLPLSLLVDQDGAFALERHAFAYPLEIAGPPRAEGQAERQYASFFGIGAPALPGPEPLELAFRGPETARSVAQLGQLGLAEDELRRMAAALQAGETQILAGADATEARMRASGFARAELVTFATHGVMAGELAGLDEAALVLSPPRDGEPAGGENDGLLTASEIATLDFAARLVVLSACNTAGGAGADGEAFGGLAQAFLYAGADSLLVSHWRVRDDAAARLSVATAQGAAGGLSPAQALRRAKLDLMRDSTVPMGAHPAIWASFVFVGT